MQVTFTFEANDPAIKTLLPALLARMSDEPTPTPEPQPEPTPAPEPAPEAPAEEPPPPTAAQQRAAHARAARAARQQEKTAAKAPDPLSAAEDVSGPAETNGADHEDDFGMTSPSMSPGEAHEAALALVREIHAAGKIAEVKKLQKDWEITKFYDIPLDKAFDFYRSVMNVAHETGLRK